MDGIETISLHSEPIFVDDSEIDLIMYGKGVIGFIRDNAEHDVKVAINQLVTEGIQNYEVSVGKFGPEFVEVDLSISRPLKTRDGRIPPHCILRFDLWLKGGKPDVSFIRFLFIDLETKKFTGVGYAVAENGEPMIDAVPTMEWARDLVRH